MRASLKRIVVLEDDPHRIQRMLVVLDSVGLRSRTLFFPDAPSAIAWLSGNIAKVCGISLDHDLVRHGMGERWPGTGMDVVEWLECHAIPATPQPTIIIHSDRGIAALMMMGRLEASGYRTDRVIPHECSSWIENQWISFIRSCFASK